MSTFLSNDAIQGTDHISEEVLQNIAETDFLIVIVETNIVNSKWVEWEHNFCVERGISPLYVVFPAMRSRLHEIPYINLNLSRITYDDYNDDKLKDRIVSTIFSKNNELEQHARNKKSIIINAKSDKSNYVQQDSVQISGNIKKLDGSSTNNFTSKTAYLHIPNINPKFPPKSTKIKHDIETDSKGNFNFNFVLPNEQLVSQKQTWFLELKFDNKSEMIPLIICPQTNDSPTESGTPPTSPPKSLISWKEKIKSFSIGTFQSIPKKIRDYKIPRHKEVNGLMETLQKKDRVVVIGNKGAGKSVLLCEVFEKLNESYDVLFIRCDDYLHIQSITELQKIIDDTPLSEIISRAYSASNRLVVIFDSLDAISRNVKTFGLFKQLLIILWGTNKVKTICSVRSYDYDYSPLIRATDWGVEYSLKEISDKELDTTINYLGNPKVPKELKTILKNPLHLKLLSMILDRAPNADFTNITSEVELYNEHWKEYVEKSKYPIEVSNTLFTISDKMVNSQRIVIPFDNYYSKIGMDEVLHNNLIEIDSSGNFIQFFHHAYLDYVISKIILQKYNDFVEFLAKEEYNIFLRPTIIFTLSILYNKSPKNYLSNLELILRSNLKFYWKISTLHSVATIEKFTAKDVEKFGSLLQSDPLLQRHFLREIALQKNSSWFAIWHSTFFKTWFEKDNQNDWFLLNYIQSIIDLSYFHERIFDLLQSLVQKNSRSWDKKTAIELSGKLSKVDRYDWYLRLSKNEDFYVRWGVLETLKDFIETNKHDIHKIFCNIFLYKEESDEKSQLISYGTFSLNSTKKQDNRQVIWMAGEKFPELLKKNPKEMILATIKIIESIRKDYLEKQEGKIIEDGGYIWYDVSDFYGLHDENKLLSHVTNYLKNCDKEKLASLLSILTKTKLATIHNIVLEVLMQNPQYFKDAIFDEISNPECYKIETLRNNLRKAIHKVSPFLQKKEIGVLLELVMKIKFPQSGLDDEKTLYYTNKLKAEFLSEFPLDYLGKEHKELLSKYPKKELEYAPQASFKAERGKPPKEVPKPKPEEIIESNLGKELDHNKTIELLDSTVEYLGKKTEELDSNKVEKIKEYIIKHVEASDPKDNVEEKEDSSLIFHYNTIRGITARGIIRIFYHTKDEDLIQIIKKLANDPINIVRGEVARELRYLYFVNYPVTIEIARRYSSEPDHRVQFFLVDIISIIAHKHPDDAIELIRNIFSINKTRNFKHDQFHDTVILHLALNKQNEEANKLLNEIFINNDLKDARLNIPFILKESFLFKEKTQDKSLDIFYQLLQDEDHEIREKATFFLLTTIEDEKIENIKALIEKIGKHLDLIAKEMERRPWDPRIIEELVRFLEKNWRHLPEKTIEYLEKISEDEYYSTYQPVFARGTVTILNGIFREPDLTPENRKRCLSVLDTFAKAGWFEALDLLTSMERPD